MSEQARGLTEPAPGAGPGAAAEPETPEGGPWRGSNAELLQTMDCAPVLIAFVDRTLVFRFANRAYGEWFGVKPGDVVGRSIADVVGEHGFALRRDALERALAGETVLIELPWTADNGRFRLAEARYAPRRGADGAIDGLHIFVTDITSRKEAEATLRDATAMLEQRVIERTEALQAEMAERQRAEAALRQSQKMEAVGQLTGGIAHDFNNMLTGIIGALDLMKRRIASGRSEDLHRFMDAAVASALRAASLTHRLLAFSRRQSLDPQPTDINALVGSLDDLLRRTIGEQVELAIDISPVPLVATVDANQLENALLNLAINARDAMPHGGRLTISTCPLTLDAAFAADQDEVAPGPYVMIAVDDSGTGMSPAVLAKVFDPFFTTKPIGQGTGLGLSMIYGFAKQSGGHIRISSAVDRGTTVRLYLPAQAGAPHAPDSPAPESVPSGDGETVLVVEDDTSVRLLVLEVLTELGYSVREAATPDDAIAVIETGQRIDLLITDVGLPGMNGRQLAEIARRLRPRLKVLFITAYAAKAAERATFLGAGMDLITKPFALDALAVKIRAMTRPD